MDEAKARAIADRDKGIGCDQLIVLDRSDVADVRMRIWNNGGGEVESCGNASRCIADLLFDEKGATSATIDTEGGFLVGRKAGRSSSPSTMASRSSAGRTFRCRNPLPTRAISNCRLGRSMRRSSTRPRSSMSAIRIASSG